MKENRLAESDKKEKRLTDRIELVGKKADACRESLSPCHYLDQFPSTLRKSLSQDGVSMTRRMESFHPTSSPACGIVGP